MLDHPRIELEMRRSKVTVAKGRHAGRAMQFIELWRQHTGILEDVECTVHAAPPEHVGLGLGTQLGLSIATGLDLVLGEGPVPIDQRARSVGRGKRSAIGSYGFQGGGLIIECGKEAGDWLGKMTERITLPAAWRVVLVRCKGKAGLAGETEKRAFDQLSEVPVERQRALHNELFELLAPAGRAGDFVAFSESVYRYGTLAGESFAACQAGAFASAEVARTVKGIQELGVRGVGQSSWGPTVFCWLPDAESATKFADSCQAALPNLDGRPVVAKVAAHGAQIETR